MQSNLKAFLLIIWQNCHVLLCSLESLAQYAGTRIQVPGYLMDNFRALEAVGYSMKKAGSNVKRSVKFDDLNQDLVLDIKIGEEWMRINPAEAKAVCRENPEIRAGPKKMGRNEITKFLGNKSKPDDNMSDVEENTEDVVIVGEEN